MHMLHLCIWSKYIELFITLTFKYNAGVEKEDKLPTILFSKEKLEMPLKENAGKMAGETDQPGMFCVVFSNVYK